MATVETAIWQAVKARVQSLPAPVNYPSMPGRCDWPLEVFTKPQAGAVPVSYLEVRHLPNTSVRRFIGSNDPHERMGILQLSLMWPVSDVGQGKTHPDVLTQMAGLIAAHFPTDLRMVFQDVTVRVEKAADVAQPYRDEAYWRVPTSIRWRCWA